MGISITLLSYLYTSSVNVRSSTITHLIRDTHLLQKQQLYLNERRQLT
jgi:hypothetical protein